MGDTALRAVADSLVGGMRREDHLARTGGDEFVVIAEADIEGARTLAENLRRAVEKTLCAVPDGPTGVGWLFALADNASDSKVRVEAIHDAEGYRKVRSKLADSYDISAGEPTARTFVVAVISAAKLSALPGVRVATVNGNPAFARLRAMGAPIIPRPIRPTCMRLLLLSSPSAIYE